MYKAESMLTTKDMARSHMRRSKTTGFKVKFSDGCARKSAALRIKGDELGFIYDGGFYSLYETKSRFRNSPIVRAECFGYFEISRDGYTGFTHAFDSLAEIWALVQD